jgi:hypothetical protein
MTHSIDSFITDSANSATALYTGHKSTVNALGVYADTSPDAFDDPKVETIAEIFHRMYAGHIGIVSTAYIADATPAALTAHTRDRGQYGAVIDSFLHGIVNYTYVYPLRLIVDELLTSHEAGPTGKVPMCSLEAVPRTSATLRSVARLT